MRRREAYVQAIRDRETNNAIMRRAVHDMESLQKIREDKRRLLHREKQLRASRDVTRTNARYALAVQEKSRRELDRILVRNSSDS